jgi:hypothetical protein
LYNTHPALGASLNLAAMAKRESIRSLTYIKQGLTKYESLRAPPGVESNRQNGLAQNLKMGNIDVGNVVIA